jgi:hypothetical protein
MLRHQRSPGIDAPVIAAIPSRIGAMGFPDMAASSRNRQRMVLSGRVIASMKAPRWPDDGIYKYHINKYI